MPLKNLQYFLDYYKADETLLKIHEQLDNSNLQQTIKLHSDAIDIIEKLIFNGKSPDKNIQQYQSLFIEHEDLIKNSNHKDTRYKFVISIPVADRPQHLQTCLQSIFTLCEKYQYGGFTEGKYRKINVLISDDSKHIKNININKNLAKHFTKKGLCVEYFDQSEQQKIASKLDEKKSKNILGDRKTTGFFHKGASITRNITYLKLQKSYNKEEPTLFYFIDSDQEFRINTNNSTAQDDGFSVNYFYNLNKIFTEKNISILTGKVVGDPPVSPAVMASTFLDDLINFITKISKLSPTSLCEFHEHRKQSSNHAPYHDMGELFGLKSTSENVKYQCSLTDEHNHLHCFNDLTNKLKHFFYGEHPTRKTHYQYENALDSIQDARTIYTGNYIFKPENLKYFIPFANLKLRMAGPVLGRILQTELHESFASANLPMLHKRTVESLGQSEFRAGVIHKKHNIDLTEEFTRQFFGDAMLFSIIKLTELGYPLKDIPAEKISVFIYETINELKIKYTQKHEEISNKNILLSDFLNLDEYWWTHNESSTNAINELSNFINNIHYNFNLNSDFHKTINSTKEINKHHHRILDSITNYSNNRSYWQSILSEMETTP